MLVYLFCLKEKHGPRTYFEKNKFGGKKINPFILNIHCFKENKTCKTPCFTKAVDELNPKMYVHSTFKHSHMLL